LIESERKMKTLQNKVDREPDINFEDQIVAKALQIECGDRGGSLSVARPPFQEDSYITKHTIKGKCDIIVGNDSDYTVLCGGKAVMLTSSKFVIRSSQLTDGVFKCCDVAMLEHVKQANNNLKATETPLIDGLADPRMRIAITLSLGCDTFPGGINNIGPSKIRNIINNKNPSSVTEFLRIVEGKQQTFGTKSLHTFIDV
jgi:hypothetical protein